MWAGNAPFMAWNLTLALVLGLVAFLAFLPNAPYVLSDVVHLADDVRVTRSDTVVVAGVLPQYAAFFLAGLLAYVVALGDLTRWLARRGWDWVRVVAVELAVHAVCAVGVYLGRIPRFNSWDL